MPALPNEAPAAAPSAVLRREPLRLWLGFLALVLLLGVAIYAPVAHYGFLEFDDAKFIRPLNGIFPEGITPHSLRWAFLANLTQYSEHAEYWCPLTLVSRLADIQFHGENIGAYHLTNLALHLLNAVLLALVLRQFTGRVWPSMAVALLFLTHPLNAEPVAWLSARKDLLNGFFFFGTLLAYGWYVRKQTRARYAAMLAVYLCCLMAKPMGITLPFLLLILDAWPLGRWPTAAGPEARAERLRLLLEKLPLLLMAAPVAYLAVVSQQDWQSLVPTDRLPIWMRLTNAVVSYGLYLRRIFWPSDLAIFYPHPLGSLSVLRIGLSLAALLAITGWAFAIRKRAPMFLAGWLWFGIILGPVSGMTQLGSYAMADRYVYLAALGPMMAVVWWIADHWQKHRPAQYLAATLAILLCTAAAIPQAASWRDDLTAFTRAIPRTERNWMAHLHIGGILFNSGRLLDGYDHTKTAVRLNPGWPTAWTNLGEIEMYYGHDREAMRCLATALQLDPKRTRNMLLIGLIERKLGEDTKAEAAFRRILTLTPQEPAAHLQLGQLFADHGRWPEAVQAWGEYLRQTPGDTVTRGKLVAAEEEVRKVAAPVQE